MTIHRRQLPRLDDLPIPEDVVPNRYWPASMVEMADHIGAYHTLLLVQHFGGQHIYIPENPDNSPFRDVVGPAHAATIAHVYGPTHFQVPVGRIAINHARRAGVLRAVRQKMITSAEAARILGMGRSYISHLINQTLEGTDQDNIPPQIRLISRSKVDPRQIPMFPEIEEKENENE